MQALKIDPVSQKSRTPRTYIHPTRIGWLLIWTGLLGLIATAMYSDSGGGYRLIMILACGFLSLLLIGTATGFRAKKISRRKDSEIPDSR